MPQLETAEILLGHCNFVNNTYQLDLIHFHEFTLNKPCKHLLENSPTVRNKFNSKFLSIKIWVTDQIYQPLEIENRISLNLIIS